MSDLLLPAYQKLYAALCSLERFSKGKDLFENIACIDSFLSEFRNITFVLQKSLAHTEFLADYETLRDKHLRNDDCAWLVEKRNEVLKEKPFNLEKSLKLTLYLPNGAGVFSTETYTIEDEKSYSSLIKMIKRVIEKIPAIEVFFSTEFVFRETSSDKNIFETIDSGIDSMSALLEELDKTIPGEASKTRGMLIDKIKDLHFHVVPQDCWFVDDYVFYRQDHVFEKGGRFEILTPFKTAIPYTKFCEIVGVKNEGHLIDESFDAFVKMHIIAFSRQKTLAPTLLTIREDGIIGMTMYEATIKTTTYRKIHEIAEEIEKGEPIVAVFHATEMLCYGNPDAFLQDYSHRSKTEHTELLSFDVVTKEGSDSYCISSEAVLDGVKDCRFPVLTKVETDDAISYMNPLVDAFQKRVKHD